MWHGVRKTDERAARGTVGECGRRRERVARSQRECGDGGKNRSLSLTTTTTMTTVRYRRWWRRPTTVYPSSRARAHTLARTHARPRASRRLYCRDRGGTLTGRHAGGGGEGWRTEWCGVYNSNNNNNTAAAATATGPTPVALWSRCRPPSPPWRATRAHYSRPVRPTTMILWYCRIVRTPWRRSFLSRARSSVRPCADRFSCRRRDFSRTNSLPPCPSLCRERYRRHNDNNTTVPITTIYSTTIYIII